MSDRLTDRLRSESDWDAAVDHRFVCELRAGTLDDDAFRRYLLQDYAFLEELVSLVGRAVADAPTVDATARLSTFLAVLTDDEDDYFERSFEALGVEPSTYGSPELTPTTAAFRDHLRAAASTGGYAETLAVLVPAEWVYREWATAVTDPPEAFYLAEWIDLHANDEFVAFVDWLCGELDRVGEDLSDRRTARVARRFERTVALEVAFFDAACEA